MLILLDKRQAEYTKYTETCNERIEITRVLNGTPGKTFGIRQGKE